MSFRIPTFATVRLNRSQLFVLANKPENIETASRSSADVVMFEVEDGVPPQEKSTARQNVVTALNDIDWGNKSICVRINGLDARPGAVAVSQTVRDLVVGSELTFSDYGVHTFKGVTDPWHVYELEV